MNPDKRLRGFGFEKISDDTWERYFPYQRNGRFTHHIRHLRVRRTPNGFTILRCTHEYRSRKVTEHVLFRVASSGDLFPKLQELFDKEGKLLEYLSVFVNREIAFPDELATPVKDGDEIHLIPLIGGG